MAVPGTPSVTAWTIWASLRPSRKSWANRLRPLDPGCAVVPWQPEQAVVKISCALVCNRAGTGAASLRGGILMSLAAWLAGWPPGCAKAAPDRVKANAASKMRFISHESFLGDFPDYSALPDRGNGAFELVQGEADVGLGMRRGQRTLLG